MGVRHRKSHRTGWRHRAVRRHAPGQETLQRAPPNAPPYPRYDGDRQPRQLLVSLEKLQPPVTELSYPCGDRLTRTTSCGTRTDAPAASARASWTASANCTGSYLTSTSASSTTSSRPTRRSPLLVRLMLPAHLARGASDSTEIGEALTPARAQVHAKARKCALLVEHAETSIVGQCLLRKQWERQPRQHIESSHTCAVFVHGHC